MDEIKIRQTAGTGRVALVPIQLWCQHTSAHHASRAAADGSAVHQSHSVVPNHMELFGVFLYAVCEAAELVQQRPRRPFHAYVEWALGTNSCL